ncbi:MAG: translocation/assembly module TamB domain-containing protein [Legionella sp.]|nr:translocation/assembly module TamB domain-containing protein [Legionella sp.]
MKLIIKRILLSLLTLSILLIGMISFLITTTPGLYVLIKIGQLYIPGALTIHTLQGRLIDQVSIDSLEYKYKTINIHAEHIKLQWTFKLLINKALWIKALSAKTIVINELPDSINDFSVQGTIDPQHWEISQLHFNYLNQALFLKLQKTEAPKAALSGNLSLDALNKYSKLTGKVKITGSLADLKWSGSFLGLIEGTIDGHLKQSEFSQNIQWHALKLAKDMNSSGGHILVTGIWPNINAEVQATLNPSPKDDWILKTKAQGILPWNWQVQATVSHKQKTSMQEGFFTKISAQAKLEDTQHGTLHLTLAPGQYVTAQSNSLPSLTFEGGTYDVDLKPKGLQGKGSFQLNKTIHLDNEFKLPAFDLLNPMEKNKSHFGQISLVVNSLSFLETLYPGISQIKGSLTAFIKSRGKLNKPIIESQLKLTQGSLILSNLGLTLDNISCQISGKKHHWLGDGTISSKENKLILKGKGLLSTPFEGNISLQGSQFPLITTPEYQLKVSPDLIMKFSKDQVGITGDVVIPYAQIKPQTLTNSMVLSDDVVYKKNHQEATPIPFNTSMDVQLKMGDEVEVAIKGLHATLEGGIRLTQAPKEPLTANGVLSIKKGEYKAYGQILTVEQGQLMYVGGRLDNPGINLRASKKIIQDDDIRESGANKLFDLKNQLQNSNVDSNTKVGVEVTDRLTSPKIQLFSSPTALSQTDILSMLILNRPASKAKDASGQLLLAALSSMNWGNGSEGTQFVEHLKQSLGFDVNIQTNTKYDQANKQFTDSTGIVVGKSLTKKLYLSYNMGLSQANPNVLTLKYLINKFFSIQISNSRSINGSSSGSGMDVLYSGERKKLHE